MYKTVIQKDLFGQACTVYVELAVTNNFITGRAVIEKVEQSGWKFRKSLGVTGNVSGNRLSFTSERLDGSYAGASYYIQITGTGSTDTSIMKCSISVIFNSIASTTTEMVNL